MKRYGLFLVVLCNVSVIGSGSEGPADSSSSPKTSTAKPVKITSILFDSDVVKSKQIMLDKVEPVAREAGYPKTAAFLGVWSAALNLVKGSSTKTE